MDRIGAQIGTCEFGRRVPRDAGQSRVCPEDDGVKGSEGELPIITKFYGGQRCCSASSMNALTRVTAFSAWSRERAPFF